MNTVSDVKIESHRRLCIVKDLNELSHWMTMLEWAIKELDHLCIIEKQLVKSASIPNKIHGLRRKIILSTAHFCKYEQELNTELDYGKTEYNISRAKVHEVKRQHYLACLNEHEHFKITLYGMLEKFQRK
ncbi:hypothetical protein [Olleya sp. HaHaR_3_96]|uniref:hypothetical protein n=1 Tax=Olleya sp. HaHaR_3_96 TaxID=2745560 RepID=UPI001C4F2D74|nr:hypothetical protein [Olleya sp. HaHaR_3_96]QXP59348.1 hypothetical protein H0I26_15695 [Olleya sp. HaHaR_3_96]